MAQEIYHRSEWGNPNEQWGNVYLNADLTNELYKRASEYENSWVTDQLLNGVGTKPSIILTPTAYEDGKLNSVKPAKTLGSELVTNGDFATDLSGWTNSNNHWQWTSQGAYFPLISTHNPLTQILTNPVGVKLKITFTLNIIQGTANFYYYNINNLILAEQYTESGTYTIETELVKQNTNINFSRYGGINTEFYLDNVSVKELTEADFDFTRGSSATRVNEQGLVEDVQILSGELVQNGNFEQIGSEQIVNGGFDTDSDWTKGTGWSISGGKAISDGTIGSYNLTQGGAVTVGKIYKITITVSDYVSGNVEVSAGAAPRGTMNANGTYTFYQYATPANSFYIIANSFEGSIDNVSVKEVGQNWLFQNGWNMGDGVAVYSGTVSAYRTIYQENVLTVSSKYRLTFDIVSIASGSIENISQSSPTSYNTVGTKTEDFIATSTDLFLKPTNDADLTIDNVSVVEITDDTDLPRINYTDGEGSLLLEPQSTNLVTYSEDFSSWSIDDVTIESDSNTSPDGNTKATLLKGNTNSSRHHIRKTLSGTVDGSYSIFAKAKELRYLQIASINTTNQYVNFDLQDGLVGTVGSDFSNAKIEKFGNGWYRLSVTSDSRYNSFYISLVSGTNATWLESWVMSNNTDGLYIWGAQLEESSYATSYIPTNGSTVTRLADVCNNSGSSDLINSTEGVLYAEVSALADDSTYRLMSISDGTTANRIVLGYSNGSNLLLVQVFSSGGSQVNFTYSISDITLYNKIALLYKSNEVTIWVNGVKGTSDTSASMPIGLSEFNLNYTYSLPLYGNVKCLAVFKEALSDTELQKLTTI